MSLKKLILTILLAPALLAAFLFVTRWSGASAQAATPAVPDKITITGQVAMGTPGLTLPITTSLLLHAHDGHEMALMLDGQADAQGAFRFAGLENKPGRTFDIMAIVGPTTYFAEQIVPQDGQAEYKAAIKLFGTTKDTSTLRVDRLHNFVEFINRQQVRGNRDLCPVQHGRPYHRGRGDDHRRESRHFALRPAHGGRASAFRGRRAWHPLLPHGGWLCRRAGRAAGRAVEPGAGELRLALHGAGAPRTQGQLPGAGHRRDPAGRRRHRPHGHGPYGAGHAGGAEWDHHADIQRPGAPRRRQPRLRFERRAQRSPGELAGWWSAAGCCAPGAQPVRWVHWSGPCVGALAAPRSRQP